MAGCGCGGSPSYLDRYGGMLIALGGVRRGRAGWADVKLARDRAALGRAPREARGFPRSLPNEPLAPVGPPADVSRLHRAGRLHADQAEGPIRRDERMVGRENVPYSSSAPRCRPAAWPRRLQGGAAAVAHHLRQLVPALHRGGQNSSNCWRHRARRSTASHPRPARGRRRLPRAPWQPLPAVGRDTCPGPLAIGSSGVPETFVIDKTARSLSHIGDIRPEHVPILLEKLAELR